MPLPSTFHSSSKEFLLGIGKDIATAKENGDMDVTEGRDVLLRDGYKSLCKVAISSSDSFTAHLFLTLAWNFMT